MLAVSRICVAPKKRRHRVRWSINTESSLSQTLALLTTGLQGTRLFRAQLERIRRKPIDLRHEVSFARGHGAKQDCRLGRKFSGKEQELGAS
jgi:hypothetical protein